MHFSNRFQVSTSLDETWQFLENQPINVGQCIPGTDLIEALSEDLFHLIVTQKVGHLKATFDLQAAVEEKKSGDFMRLSARGKSVRGARTEIRASALVSLTPVGDGVEITITSDVNLTGMLAALGRKVLEKRSAEIINEFADSLRSKLEAAKTPNGQFPLNT